MSDLQPETWTLVSINSFYWNVVITAFAADIGKLQSEDNSISKKDVELTKGLVTQRGFQDLSCSHLTNGEMQGKLDDTGVLTTG